jgi:sec-independent protein translocase protein TatC
MPLFFDEDGPAGDRPMTLAEHLDELRKRVFVCVIIAAAFCIACAYYEQELLGVMLMPAFDAMKGTPGCAIVATEAGEMFFTGMKVDVIAGLFLAAPLILYVLWGFVARGLHAKEKRFVRIYAPVSYVLFLGGCVFFYFVIQRFTLQMLLNYHVRDIYTPTGETIPIEVKLKLENAIGFFLSMTLVTGLIFELPLVMLFLQAIRICSWKTFSAYRKHFFFGLLVFAAVITPTGDALTLAVFMVPLYGLFEGGIIVCRMMAPDDI